MHLVSSLSNFDPPQLAKASDPPVEQADRPQTRSELGKQAAELRERLVERYTAGETVKALAAEHGLHHQTVRAVLVEAGAVMRTRQRLTQEQLDEIVRLYESGLTTSEIGERFGVYASTIGRQLKKRGVELRAPGWR